MISNGKEEEKYHQQNPYVSPVRLDIHTPSGGVQAVGSQGTITAEVLHLIHDFIATIVPCTRETLGVL